MSESVPVTSSLDQAIQEYPEIPFEELEGIYFIPQALKIIKFWEQVPRDLAEFVRFIHEAVLPILRENQKNDKVIFEGRSEIIEGFEAQRRAYVQDLLKKNNLS